MTVPHHAISDHYDICLVFTPPHPLLRRVLYQEKFSVYSAYVCLVLEVTTIISILTHFSPLRLSRLLLIVRIDARLIPASLIIPWMFSDWPASHTAAAGSITRCVGIPLTCINLSCGWLAEHFPLKYEWFIVATHVFRVIDISMIIAAVRLWLYSCGCLLP